MMNTTTDPKKSVEEKARELLAKNQRTPSQPSSMSNKKAAKEGSKVVRESLSAIAERHPILKRYLDFSRNALAVCEMLESSKGLMSPESDRCIAEVVRAFYFTECSKSATHSALPRPKRAADKAPVKADQTVTQKSTEVRDKDSQKTAVALVPLRTRVPRYSTSKGEFVAISKEIASAMNREQEIERSMIWGKISSKHREALMMSRKTMVSDEKYLKENCDQKQDMNELVQAYGLSNDRVELFKILTARDPRLAGVNVVDVKIFASLKKAQRLAPVAHAIGFLNALLDLARKIPSEYKLSETFPTNLAASREDMQIAVTTSPLWAKTRNWGRFHPKILLLQVVLEEKDEKLNELLTKLSQISVFTEATGPMARSTEEKKEVLNKGADEINPGKSLLEDGGRTATAIAEQINSHTQSTPSPTPTPPPPPSNQQKLEGPTEKRIPSPPPTETVVRKGKAISYIANALHGKKT